MDLFLKQKLEEQYNINVQIVHLRYKTAHECLNLSMLARAILI